VNIFLIVGAVAAIGLFAYLKKKKRGLFVNKKFDYDILEIKVPRGISKSQELEVAPLGAEHMFASLHGLLREKHADQEQFTFEFVSDGSGIRFYSAVPKNISKFVESQIYAQYPEAQISKVKDYVRDSFSDGKYKSATLSLAKEDFFPIKTFRDFEIDPLAAITSALGEVNIGEDVWFQLVLRPVPDVWQQDGYDYVSSVLAGNSYKPPSIITELPKAIFSEVGHIVSNIFMSLLGRMEEDVYSGGSSSIVSLSSAQELEVKSIESKLSKMGFDATIRILAHADTDERADSLLRSVVASMKQFSTAHLNGFVSNTKSNDADTYNGYKDRLFSEDALVLLNIEELASIYHLPSGSVETPGVSWVSARSAEPPENIPTEDCNYIGTTYFRDKKIKFGISNKDEDRVRHMYLVGKTGTGKSTYFKNMIMQDIKSGVGVGVVDPHGELIEDILEYIPEERIDDVVIIDPSDTQNPVGVNVLEMSDKSQKNLMASALVSSMKQQFDYSWGPRLEYLLNYAVLTLLEVPGTTMLGITRLLNDMNYQNYILHFIKDPVVRDFWDEEYKAMRGNQRLITEAVAPIQNKINRFLSSTTIRNILGQRNSTVDFWDIMNNQKILLLNLSKGRIGTDNANLLGALLISRIQFMAMQRVKIPQEQRKPFYLYVDEFQNFAGGNFESILSESRKYRLALHLTHQYTSQLPEDLLSAVLGNVGTIASFSLGAPDARALESEFSPFFDENDLISLMKFQIYIKLMIDGQTSKPFSATIFKPWIESERVVEKTSNKQAAIKKSREKYGTDRTYVEEKIRKWVEYPFDKGKAIAQSNRQKDKQTESGGDNVVNLRSDEIA